jgi:hypothetical protein
LAEIKRDERVRRKGEKEESKGREKKKKKKRRQKPAERRKKKREREEEKILATLSHLQPYFLQGNIHLKLLSFVLRKKESFGMVFVRKKKKKKTRSMKS